MSASVLVAGAAAEALSARTALQFGNHHPAALAAGLGVESVRVV
jgi:hypothetical protein